MLRQTGTRRNRDSRRGSGSDAWTSSTGCANAASSPTRSGSTATPPRPQLQRQYAGLAAGTDTGRVVRLAGRLLGERRHGGLDFADLRDETGAIQLLVTRDEVGEQALQDFSDLDLGDWVGVEGTVVASDHGELSVRVKAFELLSKSLRAMPERPPRPRRPRGALPPPLPGPDPERDDPADVRDPLGGDRGDAAGADRARLSRGRDAGAAGSGGRRRRAAVHHPPQLARHRHDAADRARAAAQAADRRRHGPGVRDRPRVPQRGPGHATQPRVHAAGGLPGVRRLPRHDGPDRGDHRRLARRGDRDHRGQDRRPRGRPQAALAPGDDGRADQRERRRRDAPDDARRGGPQDRRRARRRVARRLGARARS